MTTQQQAWQHDGCADLEAMTPMQLLTFDQQRYVADPYGDLCRAQQRIDNLQRIALFGLAAAIILIVLMCF
jgi:hypothetical protein